MDDKPKRLIQSFIHPTSIYRGVCYVSDTVLRSGITEMKAIRGSLAYSMVKYKLELSVTKEQCCWGTGGRTLTQAR